jgi:hypothetical protein
MTRKREKMQKRKTQDKHTGNEYTKNSFPIVPERITRSAHEVPVFFKKNWEK